MTANCRTCNAPMLWLKNDKTGKPAPIDAEPSADGNILIDTITGSYTVLTKAQLSEPAAVALTGLRYTNHWSTCRDRDAWRARAGARLEGGA